MQIDSQDLYFKKIENMPPSAKLVYKVLEFKGLLTQKDLIKETYLPARTVRSALERMNLEDARQCLYRLKRPDQFEEYLIANFACACPVLTRKKVKSNEV